MEEKGQTNVSILEKELWAFVEQMFDIFETKQIKFRGTWFEDPLRINLRSLYLQCKYITEEFGEDIITAKDYDFQSHAIVERMGKITQKILWRPTSKNEIITNPIFEWGGKREELAIEEYLDILLQIFSSCFEFCSSLLKNKEMFNCVKLATALSRTDLVSKIDKYENLEELYSLLRDKTESKYKIKIESLFNIKAYRVRCSCFHVEYSYKKVDKNKFSIMLNKSGNEKIEFSELLELSNDIFAKLNIFGLVPHFFKKKSLPIK